MAKDVKLPEGFELDESQSDSNALPEGFQVDPLPEGFELDSASTKPDYMRDAKDFGLGAINPLGFTDEAAAGLVAGGQRLRDYLTGAEGQSFLERYGKLAEEYEKPFIEAEERSPYLYGGGQVAGGVAAGLLSGGAGLSASISKQGLKAAGRQAAKEGFKQGLTKEAVKELAAKAAKEEFKKQLVDTALVGGVAGGAASFGNSRADLRTKEGQEQITRDVLTGVGTGALLTPAFNVAGHKAGEKLSDLFTDRPEFRRYLAAFQRGSKENKGFLGEKVEQEISEGVANKGSRLGEQMVELRNTLSNKLGKTLDNFAEPIEGVQRELLSTELALQQLGKEQRTLLNTREFDQLQSLLRKSQNVTRAAGEVPDTQISAKEAFDLRNKLLGFMKSSEEGGLNQIAGDLVDKIEGELGQVPGFSDALSKLKEIPEVTGEMFLNKTIQGAEQKGTGAAAEQIGQKLGKIIEGAGTSGASSTSVGERKLLRDFFNNLRQVNQENPGLLQKVGIKNIDQLEKEVQKIGDLREIQKTIVGTREQPASVESLLLKPFKLVGLGSTTTGGVGLNLANRLGQATHKLTNNPVTNFSKQLTALPIDGLKQIGQTLQQNPRYSAIGNRLMFALENGDTTAKNSALFVIMQNPELRNLAQPFVQTAEDMFTQSEESVK